MSKRKKLKGQVSNKFPTLKEFSSQRGATDEVFFSFRFLHHNVSYKRSKRADKKFLCDFLERLKKLSQLGWDEIRLSDRHQYGTEMIPISQIKPEVLESPSDDIDKLTAFRASGDKRPFLGVRSGNIFYILFIEGWYGDVYNHN